MILGFRPIKDWPIGWQDGGRSRSYSPFSATYTDTLDVLDRELHHLGARDQYLQVDARDRDCRLDGQLRADAKVGHPGCILTIDTKRHGTLVYACDRFDGRWKQPGWQANLRAIALGLEALRKVERYGIAERGQQYAGYRELGSGIPVGPAAKPPAMTAEEAANLLVDLGEWGDERGDPDALIDGPDIATAYFREAAKRHHPDRGGDPAIFRRLVEAKDLLDAATPRR